MSGTEGRSEPRVLLYAANLHAGGGVAVASSVVAALAEMPGEAPRVTVLASSEVAANVRRMSAPTESFESFVEANTYGLKALGQKHPVDFVGFDAVLTVFGPLYSRVDGPKNVMGFAQPWVAFPDNSAYARLSLISRWQTRLKYSAVGAFFARADALIVEQESVRTALRGRRAFGDIPIYVVSNVVDSLHFDEARWSPVSLPPRSGKLRLGVVSRNYPHKNLAILPEVQQALREGHGIDAEFFVTLTPEELDACSTEFQSAVQTVGALELAAAPSFNAQMDGIVLPTLLECYSATPIESLAVRRPLFASDRPFIRDTVGEHANYFDPLDPNSIADSIAAYFRLPLEERSAREEAGYRFVAESEYTSMDRARAMMEIVRQVVSGGAAPPGE